MNINNLVRIVFSILIFFSSCKDDEINNNNNQLDCDYNYKGRWLLNIETDLVSTDTVFVDSLNNIFVDSLILEKPIYYYIARFSGSISEMNNVTGIVTYNWGSFLFDTRLEINCSNNNVVGKLIYGSVIIGHITGSIDENSGAGSFTSPIFDGTWSLLRK